jgi:hypothetical protein
LYLRYFGLHRLDALFVEHALFVHLFVMHVLQCAYVVLVRASHARQFVAQSSYLCTQKP